MNRESLIEEVVDDLTDHGFKSTKTEDLKEFLTYLIRGLFEANPKYSTANDLSKVLKSVSEEFHKDKVLLLNSAKVKDQELIYLACPYTYNDPQVVEARFKAVNLAASKLMADGKYVFSPISHTHPIALAGKLPGHWEFWEGYDRRVLSACDKIVVLKLPGWEQSKGVQAEIKIGMELGIPVEYLEHSFVMD